MHFCGQRGGLLLISGLPFKCIFFRWIIQPLARVLQYHSPLFFRPSSPPFPYPAPRHPISPPPFLSLSSPFFHSLPVLLLLVYTVLCRLFPGPLALSFIFTHANGFGLHFYWIPMCKRTRRDCSRFLGYIWSWEDKNNVRVKCRINVNDNASNLSRGIKR